MKKIIRTKNKATGGITKEEKIKLNEHAQEWIKIIERTEPINKDKITIAIKELYKKAKLKEPRIVIVDSPYVMALTGGLSAAIWYLRKNKKINETTEATDAATSVATSAATYEATHVATDEATDGATYEATYNATDAAIHDATHDATDAATDDAIREATDEATNAATRVATDAATRVATFEVINDVIHDATDAATEMATRDATNEATRDATYEATRDVTDAATDDATYEATHVATDEATRDATNEATRDATNEATRDATYEAINKTTNIAINDNWLKSLIIDFVGENNLFFVIECIKNYYQMINGGNMWGQWLSFLSGVRDVLGLDLPDLKWYEECAKEGGYRLMHKEFCIVCNFPKWIKKDEQNRPHCSTGSQIEWRDGFATYYLHGIRFGKEMFEKLINHKMSYDEILAIKDVDQRNQAMAFIGNDEREKWLKDINAKIIDERVKKSINGNDVIYKLYKLPKGDLFQEDVKAMYYTCPSTGLINFSGVPSVMRTVAEAMAWKGSNDESQITAKDWELAIPLVDEA